VFFTIKKRNNYPFAKQKEKKDKKDNAGWIREKGIKTTWPAAQSVTRKKKDTEIPVKR